MIPALTVALALLLAGCGGNANVQANSNNGSAGGAVSFPGRAGFGTLLSFIFLAGVSYESDREMERTARFPGGFLPGGLHAPGLDPSRRVVEHDCARPIEDWSANLKCR
jgi:hypothetical protein